MVAKASSGPTVKSGRQFDVTLTLKKRVDAKKVTDDGQDPNKITEQDIIDMLAKYSYDNSPYSGTWEFDWWDKDFEWDLAIAEVGKKVTR